MQEIVSFTIGFYVLFAILALFCEYIDSAMGGGYGTILVPVLLAFNIDRSVLIPAVLFTEIWTGLISAILHHFVGNASFRIDFSSKGFLTNGGGIKLSEDFKISLILASCGIFGGIIAAFVAININEFAIKLYIGILVLIIGIFVFLKFKWNFSWWRITGLGLLAAFNKGMSGGGYGPLISAGQIMVNRDPRKAVASTSLSESVVCVSSLIIYFLLNKTSFNVEFIYLMIALLIGSLISVPFAVFTVKFIPIEKMQPLIGIVTMALGAFTIIRTIVL
jgi:uncharacterized membrane protein YfcA